ncbi:MAG TPA: DUF2934 domain-containing protein [Candidatus Acidoferrum sp.]|nr:DUF2934 domain-containing protein [Candidatus Acidoferrum sp.]
MKRKSKSAQAGHNQPANPPLVAGARHERIRRRAYALWEQDGRQHGKDTEHWLQAEKEDSAGSS